MEAPVIVSPAKPTPRKNKLLFWVREAISILFWFYLVTKIFIFDFDIYLIQNFAPEWKWLIYAKFFIFIGTVATIWLFTKNSKIALWLLYIIFYPVILTFRFAFVLFKRRSWILIIGIVNFVVSFLRFAKYRFIAFAFSTIAFALIFLANNHFIIDTVIVCLMFLLILVFVRYFYYAFRPSALYQMHTKIVGSVLNVGKKNWIPEEGLAALTVTQMNKHQLETWSNNLQLSVISNRFCYFLSSKLKQYQKSNVSVAFDIINVFVVTMITVLFFAAINYGLYKTNGGNFTVTVQPNFFIFFYYSITNLFGHGINEVTPITNISRIASIGEMLFSFSLIAILISLFFSIKNKRDSEEIDTAINLIKERGVEMDGFIKDKYKLSVQDAIQELDRLKAGMIHIIYYLSKNVDADD